MKKYICDNCGYTDNIENSLGSTCDSCRQGIMKVNHPIGEKCDIGCVIAQRLTSALTGLGIPYEKLADAVYGEIMKITLEMDDGDWLEMPNGDTYTKTFSMKKLDEKKN